MIKKTPPKTEKKITTKKIVSTTKRVIKKKITSPSLTKLNQNPIILPIRENNWESWQTFNPGVILLNNKIHFLYRAVGQDGISRFGYAVSDDGFIVNERLSYPVYEHKIEQRPVFNIFSYLSGGSFGGAEDPRIVRINNEDVLYIIYTACDNGLRIGLTSIKVDDFLNKNWKWKPPVLISPHGELHKNWLLFPEKINGKYAFLLSIVPKIEIAYFDNLNFNNTQFIQSARGFGPIKNDLNKKCWDKWIRGAGSTPIKTNHGWLIFYHAMDNDWSKYKAGVMLLDLNDPTKILTRSTEPILEPDQTYENNGSKAGVVYISGAVVKDELLLVYYGAADNYICVAYANLQEFVDILTAGLKPKLKIKSLKNK